MRPQHLQSVLQIEGSGGLDVLYLDYVDTCLGVPEIKAFDTDVLLLIVPESAHTMHTPIMLVTLHIDMAIKLATKKKLASLNKQWKMSYQIDYERSAVGEPRRCVNSVSDRKYCENCYRYNNNSIWNH